MTEEQKEYDSGDKNMELWKSVCTTDPAITKKVNTRGGFTAIDAQAQIKRATELWGSYGGKWGVKNCIYKNRYELFKTDERIIGETFLQAVFYYPDGEFEIATDIAYKKGNDTCKKLLTDLTTKALSKLGFNSDIFEGKGPLGFSDTISELEPITEEQVQQIFKLQSDLKIDSEEFTERLKKRFHVDNIDRLDTDQAVKLINALGKAGK